MSEIRKQDIASDEALQAPLILADGFKKAADNVDNLLALLKRLESTFGSVKGFTEMKEAVDEQTQAQKELVKIENQITTAKARNTVEYQNQQKTLATLKESQRENNAEMRRSIQLGEQDAKTVNAQNSSKKQLQAALAANRAAYDKLSASERNNAKVGGELLKVIKQQDTEVKSLSDSMGDHTKHVGNYAGAIKGAIPQLGLFGGAMGGMASGLGSASKGLTTFRGALMAIPFIAILVAITSLVSYFQRTEEGAQKLRIVMAALKQVGDLILDVFTKLGESLANLSLDKIKQGFQDMGQAIAKYVMERVQILMQGIGSLGKAFKHLFKGEFKEAAKAAGSGLLDIVRATIPVAMAIEGLVKNADKIGEAISNSYKKAAASVREAINLQMRENQLIVDKRKFLLEEVKINEKISKARETAVNQLLTNQQRLDGILAAEAAILELANKKEDLLSRELAILRERAALSKTDEETLQKIAELEAQVLSVQIARREEGRRLVSQRTSLIKAIEQEEIKRITEVFKQEQNSIKDVIELRQRALDVELAGIKQAAIDGKISRQQAEFDYVRAKRQTAKEVIELSINQYEQLLTISDDFYKELLDNDRLTEDERLKIQRESAEERMKLEGAIHNYKMQLNDAILDNIDAEREEFIDMLNDIGDYVTSFSNEITGIFSGMSQRRLKELNAEKQAVESNYQAQIDAAEGNAEYQEFLQNRLESARQKIEDKKRKEQVRQAKFEKAVSLGQAGINIAQGITAALATLNIPLAILVGILGAAQITAIAAQPIPAFAEGVKNFEGGTAIVGEEGAELIRTGNKFSLSPSKASIVKLPRGADVIPHNETMQMLASMPLMYDMQLNSNKPTEINDRDIIKELKKISSGVNGQKGYITYLDGQRISKNVNTRNAIKARIEKRNRF